MARKREREKQRVEVAKRREARSGNNSAWHSARWSQADEPRGARARTENGRIRTRESNSGGSLCACVVHDLCACTTSHDFALTQCRWQLPMERALFGSRSIEGVHPAYVVNTLTIPLGEAQPRPRGSLPPDEKRVTSAYAAMTSGHVVNSLHF